MLILTEMRSVVDIINLLNTLSMSGVEAVF